GLRRWATKSGAAVLARDASLDAMPDRASAWDGPGGVRGAVTLAAVLAERREEALFYRTLARLRLDAELPETDAEQLRWEGADKATWEALCDELGLDRLRDRPHRWRAAEPTRR